MQKYCLASRNFSRTFFCKTSVITHKSTTFPRETLHRLQNFYVYTRKYYTPLRKFSVLLFCSQNICIHSQKILRLANKLCICLQKFVLPWETLHLLPNLFHYLAKLLRSPPKYWNLVLGPTSYFHHKFFASEHEVYQGMQNISEKTQSFLECISAEI